MQEEDKYEKQADDFLRCTQTEFKAMFVKNGLYFPDDKEPRDIYEITLKRGKRIYKFKFGQSIAHSSFKLINTNTGQEVKYAWFKECFEHIAHQH